MTKRKKVLGLLGAAVLFGGGYLIYLADKEGEIDIAWMWGFDGYAGYNPPKATEENLAELRDRTLSDMIHIPGGSFMMGDFELDVELIDGTIGQGWIHTAENIFPAHKVTLDSYYIGRFEATNYDFDLYSDANDLPLLPPGSRRSETYGSQLREGPRSAKVTRKQAGGFCAWLGKVTGQPISLPTEAQWEYAARSRGLNAPYATNTGTVLLGLNVPASNGSDTPPTEDKLLYPPDRFPPNPLGIYDMSARYREWVSDWYDEDYYLKSPELNPQGPENTGVYIVRGRNEVDSPPGTTTTYRVAERLLSSMPKEDLDRLKSLEIDIGDSTAAVRCAVQLSTAPSVLNFGREAGEIPANYPALLIQMENTDHPDWKPKIPPGWKVIDGKLVSVPIE